MRAIRAREETDMAAKIDPQHQQHLTEAKANLEAAEKELDKAMAALTAGHERADKQMITAGLQFAFQRVAAAKAALKRVLGEA